MLFANPISPENLIHSFGLIGIFAIIFAESGLLLGFFLPGDSLLFTAGAIASGVFKNQSGPLSKLHFNIGVLVVGVFVAAVAGDQVGYWFGLRGGPSLFKGETSGLLKQENVDLAQ